MSQRCVVLGAVIQHQQQQQQQQAQAQPSSASSPAEPLSAPPLADGQPQASQAASKSPPESAASQPGSGFRKSADMLRAEVEALLRQPPPAIPPVKEDVIGSEKAATEASTPACAFTCVGTATLPVYTEVLDASSGKQGACHRMVQIVFSLVVLAESSRRFSFHMNCIYLSARTGRRT